MSVNKEDDRVRTTTMSINGPGKSSSTAKPINWFKFMYWRIIMGYLQNIAAEIDSHLAAGNEDDGFKEHGSFDVEEKRRTVIGGGYSNRPWSHASTLSRFHAFTLSRFYAFSTGTNGTNGCRLLARSIRQQAKSKECGCSVCGRGWFLIS